MQNKTTLISPFVGCGVFELSFAITHPHINVQCFDINPNIINFHIHAQNSPKELRENIQELFNKHQPITKEKHTLLIKGMSSSTITDAAIFYICIFYSFAGNLKFSKQTKKFSITKSIGLYPKNITFALADCFDVLSNLENVHNGVFLYLDPPYTTQNADTNYTRAGGSGKIDHERLVTTLIKIQDNIPWVLSYDDVELIQVLYCRFQQKRIYKKTRTLKRVENGEVVVGGGFKQSELIITNKGRKSISN
jgi:site-specific DNA-adenine methylase